MDNNISNMETNSINLDIVYSTNVNAFCKLITTGNYDAVKSMIIAGVDIDKKSVGMTPLMYAARYNNVNIVKLLIANNANLKVKSDKGYTALKYAKISKAHDTYKIIEDATKAKKKAKRKRK
ncbi:ankyrin repeat domain-containing protein [Aureibaculum sp. A20]|uniref:Ankyrin repeat domain-containing protein n=2 Tax=Aureibaculum flavum TaxID=2795986 RepID=A0ABS0WVY2_9FLAO|nr:ankyrin repeat domain-containing protein [Aureibaculum flavum]